MSRGGIDVQGNKQVGLLLPLLLAAVSHTLLSLNFLFHHPLRPYQEANQAFEGLKGDSIGLCVLDWQTNSLRFSSCSI